MLEAGLVDLWKLRTWMRMKAESRHEPIELNSARTAEALQLDDLQADILFLKHVSSIFRQSFNPVCGSQNTQASSLWAKHHRAYPVLSWRNHIQYTICYCKALEKGCLPSGRVRPLRPVHYSLDRHFCHRSVMSQSEQPQCGQIKEDIACHTAQPQHWDVLVLTEFRSLQWQCFYRNLEPLILRHSVHTRHIKL